MPLTNPSVTTSQTDLMTLIYNQVANGTDDPIDFKFISGSYIVLGFFKGNSTNGWSSPTNATHTVTTGKTFIVVSIIPSSLIIADYASRRARLYNNTDNVNTVDDTLFATPYAGMNIPYTGDSATATTLGRAAAGKELFLQLWNANTTKRAMGAIVIGREI